MTDRRYVVGEKVLASRAEDGENHEEASVIDFYELLIGDEKRPMVVVDFADGERKWMTATEPNVMPIEVEEEDDAAGEADGSEAAEDDPRAAGHGEGGDVDER
jgi:hypothetical protein